MDAALLSSEILRQWRTPLLAVGRAAGAAILSVYADSFDVVRKEDQSPLTVADLKSQAIIADQLHALTPTIAIISEESATLTLDATDAYWLVDPLDGTKEFINRNGEFTINIALIVNQRPVLSLVGIPVLNEWYVASVGHGCWAHKADHPAVQVHTHKPPRPQLKVLASRSHRDDQLETKLQALAPVELVSAGSALKFTRIADGSADFYPRLGPTHWWDSAAGQLLVEEAGGVVIDRRGQPFRYPTPHADRSTLNEDFLVLGDATLIGRLGDFLT